MAKINYKQLVRKLKLDLEEIIVKPYERLDNEETPPLGHFLAGMYSGISGLVIKDDISPIDLRYNQQAVLEAIQQIAEDHGASIKVAPDVRLN